MSSPNFAQSASASTSASIASATTPAAGMMQTSLRSTWAGAGSPVRRSTDGSGFMRVEIGLNASHLVGPHHVLFEGNWGFNADSDQTHGNCSIVPKGKWGSYCVKDNANGTGVARAQDPSAQAAVLCGAGLPAPG